MQQTNITFINTNDTEGYKIAIMKSPKGWPGSIVSKMNEQNTISRRWFNGIPFWNWLFCIHLIHQHSVMCNPCAFHFHIIHACSESITRKVLSSYMVFEHIKWMALVIRRALYQERYKTKLMIVISVNRYHFRYK